MSRLFRALALVLLAASCGGGSGTAPRQLDNACSIVKERPEYVRAFKAAERRWGVPVHVQMATIYQESKFISNARTPFRYAAGVIPIGRQSSAYGYSQALDGTWKEYVQDTGSRTARRDRIRDATDFMGWYMAETQERLGIPVSDTRNQYLAYHEGRSGFARDSYRNKAWLVRVAGEVDARSNMYAAQLQRCRVRGL
ncbi:transglycosylase SLT domain-containing protein [uncultured Tateyamaria sp.]|uniref:transglycosylase SLT domain-containing protein n=1 Tax=uncultured Tateyamaria sp. TaxID=455651 RepID=UPI0026060E6B|nr:transglycosylase SLT domain-containing protein [uncultured Tateyamaria sp.]